MFELKHKVIFSIIFALFLLSQADALTLNLRHNQRHDLLKSKQQSRTVNLNSQKKHQYYDLEETTRVSTSQSINYLNHCKDQCLQMHDIFPFQFKYHRVVYRQDQGDMKYVIGECLYAFQTKFEFNQTFLRKEQNKKAQQSPQKINSPNNIRNWYPWKNLQQFIRMEIFQDDKSKQQKKTWQSYLKECEDETLKLSESSRIDFKLTLVHSDFQYYQNQGFKNMRPFDDFDILLGSLGI